MQLSRFHAQAAVAVEPATTPFITITTLGIPTVTTTATPTVAAAIAKLAMNSADVAIASEKHNGCVSEEIARVTEAAVWGGGAIYWTKEGSDHVGQAGEHTVGAEGDSGGMRALCTRFTLYHTTPPPPRP